LLAQQRLGLQQSPPQSICPDGQTQDPLMQIFVLGHLVVQLPQCAVLERTSTHWYGSHFDGPGQHFSLDLHAFPHEPQSELIFRSEQCPVAAPGGVTQHVRPYAPQFAPQ
jgi:hypothetical protein